MKGGPEIVKALTNCREIIVSAGEGHVFTPSWTKPEIREIRMAYELAAARLRAVGLNKGYARAVERGIWPSLDVLPALERQRTGQSIVPTAVLWRPKSQILALS